LHFTDARSDLLGVLANLIGFVGCLPVVFGLHFLVGFAGNHAETPAE
jgi:hypothetical protein